MGVTYLKGVGAYSGTEKTLIYCVVSRLEMARMKQIIREIDPTAFISVVDVHEVYGGRTRKRIDKI
ncbi:MAG: YitT family protein [Candidatus Gastranaerophilaceae bacterium]